MTTRDDDLLLPSVAARLAGVSTAAIRTWIVSGRLPAVTLAGGYRVVRRADLLRVADERRAARAAQGGHRG
jgi:predicted site-specific integrase-resolvase